ncbi:hypothetical protein EDC01DRAFT_681458 [Geopyxis carbonaria]|nr:hypothetical protein EDC01DRAFT_681458 [Geopyxis carbonaria]
MPYSTKTVTKKVTATENVTRTNAVDSHFSDPDQRVAPTLTIFDPTHFPLAPSDLARGLLKRQNSALPVWATSIAFTSLTSACDCIVGFPSSTVLSTLTETGTVSTTITVPGPTVTATAGINATITATSYQNSTIAVSLNSTVLTTRFNNATVTKTIPITFTSTTTITENSNVTATAYPDCGQGYADEGYTGTGNRVEVVPVSGNGTRNCCNRCQNTPDCVANIVTGFECQLLINDEFIPTDNATSKCPKGMEDYPFSGSGKLFPGPCGY